MSSSSKVTFKVTSAFYDTPKSIVKAGTVIEISSEQANLLISKKCGKVIQKAVVVSKKDEKPKEKPKGRGSKQKEQKEEPKEKQEETEPQESDPQEAWPEETDPKQE